MAGDRTRDSTIYERTPYHYVKCLFMSSTAAKLLKNRLVFDADCIQVRTIIFSKKLLKNFDLIFRVGILKEKANLSFFSIEKRTFTKNFFSVFLIKNKSKRIIAAHGYWAYNQIT